MLVDAAINAPRRQTAAGTLGLFLFPFEPEPLDPWELLLLVLESLELERLEHSGTIFPSPTALACLTRKSQLRLVPQCGGTCTDPPCCIGLAAHPGLVRARAWTVLTGRWPRRSAFGSRSTSFFKVSCLYLQPSFLLDPLRTKLMQEPLGTYFLFGRAGAPGLGLPPTLWYILSRFLSVRFRSM